LLEGEGRFNTEKPKLMTKILSKLKMKTLLKEIEEDEKRAYEKKPELPLSQKKIIG
jgi:hypothetical protein